MKLRLTFLVDLDEAGLARYWERYPDLWAEDLAQAGECLVREAIAAWEYEDLTLPDASFAPDGDAIRYRIEEVV